ncbi:retrovirus-related pol polyprotein from transposon TNT 1-94 [Tanacetum coccineum]
MEAIRFTNTSEDEIRINDSSRYPPDEFIPEDDPSRQYQTDYDISYYVIPHGCSLSELTQENHVPKVIALNEPDIPLTEDTEGPPDLINTEGTHEQNVQNEQIITQLTEGPSGNNTEVSDRWSKDQHIELVNIIGDPEPKKVSEALKHPRSIDAMQEELDQFYRNKVWTLVPLPYGKIAIGSKWVFKNKKDEHGITTKNKARLVAQGYSQEEGINYDETFAPPLGFESSEFPDYVYKLDKALYGLKQAPKAWYETLSTFFIQNKFTKGRIDNTLFIYKSKRDVLLVQVYEDDIIFGSINYKLCKQFEKLMTKKFEMSMMGELTYFLRLQIKKDDKGISIYQEQYTRNLLKKYEISDSSSVKIPMVPPNNLGPDLAGFDLKGYSNSDYASCNMDRKSTSGACQILGGKLVCWSAKKQQSVAISFAEAEYVTAAGCCARILWMKSQLIDYDIHYKMVPIFCDTTSAIAISNNPVLHSRTKHIDIIYHFIRDHILKGDIE